MPYRSGTAFESAERLIELRKWIEANNLFFSGVPDSTRDLFYKALREVENLVVMAIYSNREYDKVALLHKLMTPPKATAESA